MSHRADSIPDFKNKSSDFENKELKMKEQIFGWPVSDAIAEILKRVKVVKGARVEGEGLAQNHNQRKYGSPADEEKGGDVSFLV